MLARQENHGTQSKSHMMQSPREQMVLSLNHTSVLWPEIHSVIKQVWMGINSVIQQV